jgi:hypothetical protein
MDTEDGKFDREHGKTVVYFVMQERAKTHARAHTNTRIQRARTHTHTSTHPRARTHTLHTNTHEYARAHTHTFEGARTHTHARAKTQIYTKNARNAHGDIKVYNSCVTFLFPVAPVAPGARNAHGENTVLRQ